MMLNHLLHNQCNHYHIKFVEILENFRVRFHVMKGFQRFLVDSFTVMYSATHCARAKTKSQISLHSQKAQRNQNRIYGGM